MSISLSFHGATDTVTGSCFLLKAAGLNILIDCGFFQGNHDSEDRNREDFGFDPADVDFLLLTHGHLDHCGRIPLLVGKGFRGKIICTSATYDIAKIILLDTAQIQEEDYGHWNRIKSRQGMAHPEPLYTVLDAIDSMKHFSIFAEYDVPVRLDGNISVTFRDAGHILGSSFLEIEIQGERKLIFSGDIGNKGKPVIRDPFLPHDAEIVVVETTYSDRNHKDFKASLEELKQVINSTVARGGNVIIPSFAIERAQDLLYIFRGMFVKGEMPDCRIFLDSPMGINVTRIMRRHPECYDRETLDLFNNHDDPFLTPLVTFTKSPEASRYINQVGSGAIIIAGSGMCTGGRIRHHLKHNIWRKECSIVFVGYQAHGTLGRHIVDGRKIVQIFGDDYKVNAEVHTIGGFSAHADKDMILSWLGSCNGIEDLFLVHGESEVRNHFSDTIGEKHAGARVHMPHLHDSFRL